MVGDQRVHTAAAGQRQRRRQPRARHEIRSSKTAETFEEA
jgi:hypothetical protein